MSVLIWIRTVCKDDQQTTKVAASKEIDNPSGIFPYRQEPVEYGKTTTFKPLKFNCLNEVDFHFKFIYDH